MGLKKISMPKFYSGLSREILVAGYGLPGTKKLCRNTAAAVKDAYGKAVIMSNHGAVCFGETYEDAFEVARTLEEACGDYLRGLGIEPWDPEKTYYDGDLWNNSPVIMKYMEIRDVLKPYLDDFAQLIGPKLDVVDEDEAVIAKAVENGTPLLVRGRGALCAAIEESDKEAISMVIEKNCRAALAALGTKPINPVECLIMRQFYLKKYSKRKK
jgi:L-fuculose-phosphate aldolase